MSHYPYAHPKLRNDPVTQRLNWMEHGSYWEEVLKLVPIDQIPFDEWNPSRSKDLISKFENGTLIDPVRLGYHEGKYSIVDGNHRCAVSKKFGYTHVPAIVSQEVFDKPKGAVTQEELNDGMNNQELYLVLEQVKRLVPCNGWLYQEWGGAGPEGYWWRVSDESKFPDYQKKFEVKVDGDTRTVNFEWRGKRLSHRGSKNGMIDKYVKMMNAVVNEKDNEKAASELLKIAKSLLE